MAFSAGSETEHVVHGPETAQRHNGRRCERMAVCNLQDHLANRDHHSIMGPALGVSPLAAGPFP